MTDPLTLFRQGYYTSEIAYILGCQEATAYNEIHRLKKLERAPKPITFHPNQDQQGRVPYAGREAI
ncbi:hypothetical protein O9X81_05310 [Agrobacterium salinitolerans]|uniref:hypothetical protein n=1 Tax=Agrobacterium salinitolerans TaxID=1183413 RepID=UPI0022B8112C|nr:hypothetical protein [Agrobacterium salinitolerans]MCZ7856024.1 hypothetical protein [Agrobacterium salinitolerans]